MRNQLVSVKPTWECLSVSKYLLKPLLPEKLFPCRTCVDGIRLRTPATPRFAARAAGTWSIPRATVFSADELVGAPVDDVIPAFYGELWGWQKPKQGEPVTFFVSPDDGEVELFPELSLAGLSGLGVAFGSVTGKQGSGAGFFNGEQLFDYGIGAGSVVVGASTNTVMAGNYLAKDSTRGFADFAGQLVDLGSFGLETDVTAVNEAGDVVGWSLDKTQRRRGFVYSADTWKLEPIGELPNWPHSMAVGISDNGWVLANALSADAKQSRVYLYSAQKGATPLEDLLEDPELVPLEGLAITGGDQLVVRVLLKGKPTLVVLTPESK